MNKKKCALGLVALLAATTGLASCDWPTKANNGIILTYTDATGQRVGYSAEELFGSYRQSSSSLSTEFDKVYEVLVRKYYDEIKTSTKADLETEAKQNVLSDKQKATTNANNNGTTFEEELEKILDNADCDNVDELYQYHLYQLEKDKFQSDMYQTFGTHDVSVNGVEAMKNGVYVDPTTKKETETFPKSDEWGIGNDGWLLEQMPYHIRHILVKLASGQAGNFTQDKISESTSVDAGGETTKLANVLLSLAGGYVADDGLIKSATNPATFGEVAQQYSDDGSASSYGEYGIMSKTMASDLVHEFKLGTYVFETLYNKRTQTTDYGKNNAYRLAPGLQDGEKTTADKLSDIEDKDQKLNTIDGEKSVYSFFNDKGVGQIPFGAAVALLDYAKEVKDDNGNVVNEDNDAFYPRNIIYNKYFNKHNVCVITPNAIASNMNSNYCDADTKNAAKNSYDTFANNFGAESASENGVPSTQFASLPGFSRDTKNVVQGIGSNVLTDTQGNVILAVRAGASSYQGIHFIIVQRSGLSQYGLKEENGQIVEATEESATDKKSTSLSDYYTTYTPSQDNYPKAEGVERSTYVNYNVQQTSDFNTRANTITDEIKGYNSNLNTYWFQYLVESQKESQKIEFTDDAKDIKSDIMTYCQTKRDSTLATNVTTWEDNWKEYAEQIAAQDEARAQGKDTATGSLLSEVCAIGYGKVDKSSDPNWQKGGACYYATK